ncbi:MAG: ribonuclease P protein component [Alphaproteobacteria bacterium]|nr:ribonuclease P protein component [Alphaproteobacteria bacterium]
MKKILHLKKRRDFLRVAEGIRMVVSTVILQAAPSLIKEKVPFKVGFTTTKKLGKAHVRNRARRRLRAVVREVFEQLALDNVEYVLIGRYNTATCPYKDLKSDVKWALKKANAMIEKGIYQSPPPEKKERKSNENTADFSC